MPNKILGNKAREEAAPTGDYVDFDRTIASKSVSFDHSANVYIHIEMDHKRELDLLAERGGEDDDMDAASVSSIMTADGIADPTSFRLNCLACFVSDMARGIFFPTMWNLVQILGGSTVLLGYVTASFNFGRMIVMPLFGAWSDKHGTRWTLLVSSFMLTVGTAMFSQVLNVGKPWFLLLSNMILGIGSGTLAVTRAYVSAVTPRRQRTGYMALLSAIQYAGTTVTPLLGSLFVFCFAKRNDDAESKG